MRIMFDTLPKVALVTGADRGIGAAVASRLQSDGYTVYGTSRNVDAPRSWTTGIVMRRLDVHDEAAVSELIDKVVSEAGRIDVLVNNAGSMLAGAIEETSMVEARDLFDINFFGAMRATTAVLPHMRAARSGRIIFISSVLGFLPAPFMGIYGATKHAIEGYAETLDHEVREFGIRSILIEPTFTATKLVEAQCQTARKVSEYASVRSRVLRKFADDTRHGGSPEDVADVVLAAVSATAPKLRYPVGQAKSLSRLRRFVPAGMFEKSLRRRFALET
jgi:NAD(P)-dependent dehydrogenase (short-subunit alcohol dehydrogenase family)